jgi:UDP-glucose 4-epimerase
MRIFLAGATGVIGIRLIPLMLAQGHVVAGMTRTPGKAEALQEAGVTPVVVDLFDAPALTTAVTSFRPDLVVHQVTDLPDDVARLPEFLPGNSRVRDVGTRNLLAAAREAGAARFLAQSVSWFRNAVIDLHESSVVAAGGTVLRYGQFYGHGTFYETAPPEGDRIHVDAAARRTMPFLMGPPGAYAIVEEVAAS